AQSILVQWNAPGNAQVCVQASNSCSVSQPGCFPVTITSVPPSSEQQEICIGGTVICAGQVFTSPGVFPVTLQTAAGCDSLVNCIITPITPIPPTNEQVEYCAPAVHEVCGNFYSSTGFYTTVCTAANGCDSTVISDIAIMEATAFVEDPDPISCDPGNQTVTLDGSSSNFTIAAGANVTFSWTGPSFCGPTNDAVTCADMAGTYCLTVAVERNGTECSDTYCVDVEANTETPQTPDISGPANVCDGAMETYTASAIGTPLPTGYTWTTPNGEPFTISGNTITVDWTGSPGGDLCVTADNDCGPSDPPACISVVVSLGPEDPIVSGPDMVCEGTTQTYTIDNPDPSATYSWSVPPGATFTDNGTSITVDFGGATSGDVCVTGANDCGNSMQFCLSVTVNTVPGEPFFTSGATTLCDGTMETYCVSPVTGATSYTFDTPNGVFTQPGECYTMDWTGLNSGQICVTADNDCGSSTQVCVNVTVDESPSATLSGGGDYCANSGETVALIVQLTGTGPWNYTYTDGVNPNVSVMATASPDTIFVGTAGTYTLVDVSDQTACPGTVNGQATVTENPEPTADLSGSGSICAGSGEMDSLSIDLTGTPNWNVTWTINGTAQAPLSITSTPFALPISESQAGDIELTGVTDGNGCSGIVNGMATVVVNDAPSVSGISATCDGTNTTYTVQFNISGGDTATWSVTPNTGTLSGTTYTSAPIASGTGYNFVVTDANDCNPVTVSANTFICNCESMAGDMDDQMMAICGNGPVTATYDPANEFFDADDTKMYVLHTGSGLSIINPIDTNQTEPTFSFIPGVMTYGTTYYISAVVGNEVTPNIVDLDDPCLAVAQGTPVVFREIPTGDLSGMDTVCVGDDVNFTIDFTGPGPWNVVFSDGTTNDTLTGIAANPFTLTLSPTASTNYTLLSVSNASCDGVASGSASAVVNTPVSVSNVNTACNGTFTGYTVTFQISGGDPASYTVLPAGSGTIDASGVFTSNEIPASMGYSFTVDDANSCAPQTISAAQVDCDCVTDAGVMADLTLISECGDGPVNAPHDNTGVVLDADDLLIFILHEGSGTNIVNPIDTNITEPTFGFIPGLMNYGTTYYISAVAGNDDGGGTVDLTDNCLSVAPGTPVVFYEVPTASISGSTAICQGDNSTIQIGFTGDAPFSVVINDGTKDTTLANINSNPFNYMVSPGSSTTYTLVSVMDQNCPGTVSGMVDVAVNEAPVIVNDQITINTTNTGFVVTFEIQGGDPTSYTVSPNNGTLTGNVFTSNEFPCGASFNFSVDDGNGCGPATLSNPGVDCSCISMAGALNNSAVLEVCGNGPVMPEDLGGHVLDGNDALCYMLHNGDNVPISTNDVLSFNFSPLSMTYGTSYFICPVVGDDNGNGCVSFSDPCLSIGTCVEVIFHEIPTATIAGNFDICGGDAVNIQVDFTGEAPWSFTYAPTPGDPVTVTDIMDPNYTFTVNPTVSTTYSIMSVSDTNCPGNGSGVVVVNVSDPPFATPPTVTCNTTNTGYFVSFQINGGDPASYTVMPAGSGTLDPTGLFTSNEIPDGTGYQFFIDDANGCGPVEVSAGPHDCPCSTWSGTIFPLSAINECGDGPVNIPHEGNEILDGDDVLNFFIHTGDNTPLMVSTDGNFTFDDAILDYDVVYQVCAVAGNDDGSGMVDFTDDCLSISACRTISYHQPPTATLTGDQAICENMDAVLHIEFTGTGPWSVTYTSTNGGPVTETGITDNPYTLTLPVTQSDVFTLVSVSNDFCDGTVSGSADVQVTNAPDFDLNTLTFDCDPVNFNYTLSVEITGGMSASYNVTGMSGTLNGNVFTSDPIAGLTPYQFFVDDALGCGPSELSGVSPIPTGTISGDATICLGDQTTVTFNLSGEGPYDIQYLDENGVMQSISTNQMVATIDISPTTDATITLVNVSNPNTGCGHSPNESVNIVVNQPPNAGDAIPYNVCEGVPNVVDLNTLLTGADPGGQWQNASGNVVSSNFNTEPQAAGSYQFTYVVAGNAPCPDDSETVTVVIDPLPVADAGTGGELTCDNTSVSIGSAPVSGYSYSWSLAGGPFPGDSTQATANVNLPGDYTLIVTDNATGCTNTDMVTVIQNAEQPAADVITSDVRCFGENNGIISVQNVVGGAGPYMYSFNGGPFSDQTTYTDLGPGTYSLVVEDTKGCSQTLNFEIFEPNPLEVTLNGEFEGNENVINLGDSLFLKIDVSVPFGALDVVSWFPPELLACDTCQSTWAYPTLQTTFSVTVEDEGCTASDELTVFVKKNRPVYVPNVFAPGGDGHPDNDRFRIFAGPQVARVKSFLVFNRWGETVFEVHDYDPKDPANLNLGWDGTFRGEVLDPAVFVWFAEIEFIDGATE
ncbi:MAG: hypothetical protein D6714_01440, partial [Bacteroidetes bacterium]